MERGELSKHPVDANNGGGVNVYTWEMLKLSDWRDHVFISDNADYKYYFTYYGIAYNVDIDNALTDIADPASEPVADPTGLDKVSDATNLLVLTKKYVKAAPADQALAADGTWTVQLTDDEPQDGISYVPADTEHAAGKAGYYGEYFANAPVINYQNNTANVKAFHIYVPVQLVYTYGKLNYTQKIYGVIKVGATEGQ